MNTENKTIKKIIPDKWLWIFKHNGFRRYFINTGWMFLGQIFSLIVSFFIGVWIARYLGPENYGILNYAVAFVGLFGFIASLGIDSILNRELIKTPEKRDVLLGTAFKLKVVGGIAALALAVISILMSQTTLLIQFLVIIFSFNFILQAINVISIYFQSKVESKNNVKVSIISTLISSVLKVGVILLDKGVIWIMLVYILDFVWQWINFVYVYKRQGLKIRDWKFDNDLAKKILKNSWPLILAQAAGYIYLKVDQVIIGLMLGNYEVGLYAVAVKVTEIWYFIPSIICSSLFPAIINAKLTDVKVYKKRLSNLYVLMFILSLIIAITITFLAKPIMTILFGNSYLESVAILKIYIWSSVGLFLTVAVNQYLISENSVKTIFWLNFLSMIINIGLNIWLIPLIGLLGAAWATLISYFVIPISVLIREKFFR
jgi:O-antigen/teichoic acid export membrane protein